MRIKAFKIEPSTAIKIFEKHSVLQKEIMEMLQRNPKFKKAGGNQYVAVGVGTGRYITVFFVYDHASGEAEITTAYPSDKKQIAWHRKK